MLKIFSITFINNSLYGAVLGIKMKFYLFVVVLFFELINSSAGNFYFPDQVEQMYAQTTEAIITAAETTNISRISCQSMDEMNSKKCIKYLDLFQYYRV